MFQRCFNAALADICGLRDVVIRTEDDHILEARSDQLRKVSNFFKKTLTESAKTDGKYMLTIGGISKDVLTTLLDYAETGNLTLYDHDVADVYYAAHKLQMPFVVHKCLQVRHLASPEAKSRVGRSKPAPKSPTTSAPPPPSSSTAQPQPSSELVALPSPADPQAHTEGKQDQVRAPTKQPETDIPKFFRAAPRTHPPETAARGEGVTEQLSARVQDDAYRSAEESKAPAPESSGPHKTEHEAQAEGLPAEKASVPKSSGPQKTQPEAQAGGLPEQKGTEKEAPGKDLRASKTSTPRFSRTSQETLHEVPKGATPKGSPGHGSKTTIHKVAAEEVIGAVSSQAEVKSARPTQGEPAVLKDKQPGPLAKPVLLASYSAPSVTFLDFVLAQFKQLKPPLIKALVPHQLIRLLKQDDLGTCCEIPIFMASLVWLHVDYPARSAYAKELMSCVRFSRMSASQLIHCFFPPLHPEVVEIPEVKQLLLACCCYLCAGLVQCQHLFPQYAVKPRKYSGRHRCHVWALPEARDSEEDARLELEILRETYLQRQVCDSPSHEREQRTPLSRLYNVAKTLLHRYRFLGMHYYEPDPEEMQQGPVRLRSFGKRRYSVQRRLDWTDSVWRHVGFTEGIRAPGAEPVIAVLGGIERDRPEKVGAGLCMARLYPNRSPFFKRFGILPRPLYNLKAVCFNKTIYVVGGLDLRQAALKVKRPSKCCFALDLPTMQWRRLADMSEGRVFHALVAHGGKLYAIGGQDRDSSALASAECYDPSADKWEPLPTHLCCARLAAATALLGPDHLVLAGGAMRPLEGDVQRAYLVDDVVVLRLPQLTPETVGGLPLIPKLPSPRVGSSMAAMSNGQLIVVGGATHGTSGFHSLDEVLLLKQPGVDRTWTKLCPTPYRLHSALVVAVGQDVYTIGGITDCQDPKGVHTDVLVMQCGCTQHHHDEEDLCWEPWGSLPGPLLGMEAVLFSADETRIDDTAA